MEYLITGTSSGLGKFLQKEMKAEGFIRGDDLNVIKKNMTSPFRAIIHAAFNQDRQITSHHLQDYLADNLFFVQQLLAIPHHKFIFISSADVYPKADNYWQEDDNYPIDKITGIYGFTKLTAETIIKANAQNYLILRPTALLGIHSRPNSLIKILNEEKSELTLHPRSRFNYILHQDVLQFIQSAIQLDLCGIYNLAASSSVCLEEVALNFKRNVHFGSYLYQVANVCNKKVMAYCQQFSCSSLENINRYLMLKENNNDVHA